MIGLAAALLAAAVPGADANAAAEARELVAFFKEQTDLSNSFETIKRCEDAYELTEGKTNITNFGSSLAAIARREKLNQMQSAALDRDCTIWFMGHTRGQLEATAKAFMSEKKGD